MKRKLLFTLLTVLCSFFAYSQSFTAGNLVVLRVGDGTAIGASTTNVSLLEYNAVGTLGTTVNLDAATSGSRLTLNGNSGAEGLLKLSNNKQFLTLAGYDAPTGTTTITSATGASAFTRVIARIAANGSVDYSTKINKVGSGTANADYYGGNLKVAISDDGNGFYFGNSTQGIRYVPLGNLSTDLPTIITTSSTSPSTPSGITAFTNMRSLGIFGNELYATLTNSASSGMVKIGSSLSTTAGQAPVNLTGFPLSTAFGDFVFFDLDAGVAGVDVAYSLEGTNLKKYILSGGTWSSTSSVGTGLVTGVTTTAGGSGYTSATVNITGGGGSGATATATIASGVITGIVITNRGAGYTSAPTVSIIGDGTGATATATIGSTNSGMTGILVGGKPVLFYTSGSNTTDNGLVRLNDDNGYTAVINATQSLIATSGANYVFRGVAFTPNTTTLPVDLTSFTGKNSNIGVQLNWETASERNNDRFEILRSSTKDNFKLLTAVKGKGNSDEKNNYSFIDTDPAKGVNYYKLNQIDFDGKVTSFDKLVAVNTGLGSSEFKISNSSDDLNYTINSSKSGEALLTIYDLNGRKVLTKKIFTQTGLNSDKLSITDLNNGVYVVSISLDGESFTKKFVK